MELFCVVVHACNASKQRRGGKGRGGEGRGGQASELFRSRRCSNSGVTKTKKPRM